MNLRQLFNDYDFLKVIHARKACPLRLEDRLVYSLLVYASVKNVSRSRRWIAARLCLNKNTVCRSVVRLASMGLVDPATNSALQPGEQHQGWFSCMLKSQSKWQNQFRYMPVLLPKQLPKGCTWRLLIVLWWVLGKTDDESDDLDRPYAGTEIARILRLTPPTVARILKKLRTTGVDDKGRVVSCRVPSEKWLSSHFLKSKPKKKPKLTKGEIATMSEAEKRAYVERDGRSDFEKIYAQMEVFGLFLTDEIRWVKDINREMFDKTDYLCSPNTMLDLYKSAQEEHGRNAEAGKYTSGSCWRLFRFKFIKHCKEHGCTVSA